MLRVEGVEKYFGEFKAVINANLTVKKGEIVAVIGPNGAGKTTLFNLITGHLKNDGGRIIFKDEDISGLPPYKICKKGISRTFQLVNIFPHLTVFENIQVAILSHQNKSSYLFPLARTLAVEETMTILKSVGLERNAVNLASCLSHAEQKTLEIAIALGNEPDLLLLDEPTSGLSPEEAFATIELIKELAKTHGITIIFSEHDMKIDFSIVQSIMVMNQGRTIIQEKPKVVRKNKDVQECYLRNG